MNGKVAVVANDTAATNDGKTRAAMMACMEHLDSLEPDDARRVLRTMAVWFEDPDERQMTADSIIESLGDIGQAIREGLGRE